MKAQRFPQIRRPLRAHYHFNGRACMMITTLPRQTLRSAMALNRARRNPRRV